MKNEMKTKVMIAGAAFCAALFLFSGFMLCREYLDQKQSAEAFEEVAELVKEEPDLPVLELESGPEPVQEEMTAFDKYADVYAQNSDLVGWVSIPGTRIDYPVMQTKDNPDFYLKHAFDKSYSTVIVAAISSKVDAKAKLPTHYLLKAENGLELPSLVLLEQLRTIDKRRLEHYIGRLDEHHIRRVNRALAISVGLIEEVPKNLIMCLCPACANNFYGTGSYYLRRVNPKQEQRDICTYCGQNIGYDYEVVKKPARR